MSRGRAPWHGGFNHRIVSRIRFQQLLARHYSEVSARPPSLETRQPGDGLRKQTGSWVGLSTASATASWSGGQRSELTEPPNVGDLLRPRAGALRYGGNTD